MLGSNATLSSAPALSMKRALWVGLIVAGSIAFSFVFACATPFAALATLAALNMPRRDVFSVVGLAWIANQIIGYGLLGYPQTWDSFAWGAAIGIASGLAAWAAVATADHVQRRGAAVTVGVAFVAASLASQAVMFASGLLLPAAGFSIAVVALVLQINAGALVGLMILHRVGAAIGLVTAGNDKVSEPVTA